MFVAVRDYLRGCVHSFVGDNLNIHQGRVFKMLEVVCVQCPSLMTSLIPSLTQAVRDAERKRGVGVDKRLRLFMNLRIYQFIVDQVVVLQLNYIASSCMNNIIKAIFSQN